MELKIGLGNYDRTAPLLNGDIGVAGARISVESPPMRTRSTCGSTDCPLGPWAQCCDSNQLR